MIKEGSKVSIEYTLTLEDGTQADSNVGGDALVYEQGQGQILPALEQELVGLAVDDTKSVKLDAADGYGEVNPEAFQRVPLKMVPEDAREAGTQLVAQAPDGGQMMVRVHEVAEDAVVVDMNHPLAGQGLNFDIRILAVE